MRLTYCGLTRDKEKEMFYDTMDKNKRDNEK